MHPVLTIFVPFTRRWAMEKWLENLAGVEHDPALTNLCLLVDLDEPYIAKVFKALAEEKGYRSFHVKINENWNPNEVKLAIRRMRVADVKNQSKDLIARTDGDIIISFEDDTVFERMTSFAPLYQPLLDDPTIGFVEGAQMGRWGANIIGAWEANDFDLPTEVKTLLPAAGWNGTQEITGGGFYGYATRRDLYQAHEYYTSSSQPWGPDVNFGFWLRQRGYKCLIDWDLIFGHNDHNIVGWPDNLPRQQRLVQLVFNKDNVTGKWDRTDHEPTRY